MAVHVDVAIGLVVSPGGQRHVAQHDKIPVFPVPEVSARGGFAGNENSRIVHSLELRLTVSAVSVPGLIPLIIRRTLAVDTRGGTFDDNQLVGRRTGKTIPRALVEPMHFRMPLKIGVLRGDDYPRRN